MEDPKILKIGHNIKYDKHVLLNNKNGNSNIVSYEDTMVISWLLDGSKEGKSLDRLSKYWFDYEMTSFKETIGIGKNKLKNFAYVNIDNATNYAVEDADYTLRLYKLLKPRIAKEKLAYIYEVFEKPLIDVLLKVERNGIKVNISLLESLKDEFSTKLENIKSVIFNKIKKSLPDDLNTEDFNINKFNMNSPTQVGKLFFDILKYPYGTQTVKGQWKTNEEILKKLINANYLIPKLFVEYRELEKLISTYIDNLLNLGR